MTSWMKCAAAFVLACGAASGAGDQEFRTLKVGVVVFEGVEVLDFAGPIEVFAAAGSRLSHRGRPLFEVVTVAPARGKVQAHGGVTLEPGVSIAERPQLDVVVIPGGETSVLNADPDFLQWLRDTATRAEVVMSVCNGAFVLAEAGLLDGRDATTFHGFLGFLKQEAPKTRVLSDRRVVDNGRIVTTGGVACGIDGALHLIARFGGRRLAEAVATYMEYRWIPESSLEGAYTMWATIGGEPVRLEQQIRWHRGRRDWSAMEAAARALAELDPDDGSTWYELGYALLVLDRVDEAIAASEESAKHPDRKPAALYNAACGWARKGETERALDALARAADAGWSNRAWAEQDADLASLRGDARFAALLEKVSAREAAPRPGPVQAAPAAAPAPPPAPPRDPPKSPGRPRRVAIVLFDDAALFELVGPARILDAAPGFTTYTVAGSHSLVRTDLGTLAPDYTFEESPAPDVIVLSSGAGSMPNPALERWLREHGPRAEAVLSVCNGALALAKAGLLDGRAATCPTGNLDGLLLLGKDVRPFRGRRFVRDGNVVTCDSWFAGVDGALEVVAHLCGEAAARGAAKNNLYDWRPQELDSSHPAGEEERPSHHLAIFETLRARGADAAHAHYREWLANAPRSASSLLNPDRERFGFHILAWTLEDAGRHDDATALCEWTAAAFPHSAYALACLGEQYFHCGRFEEALGTLLEADERGSGEPRALWFLGEILRHPDHVANDDSSRGRELLRRRASSSSAELAPAGEPGERMVIRGVVRDAAGKPLAGALVSVFHADASGRYTPASAMDERNARLFAFLRTDEEGRYEFATVRPGGYPQPRDDVPADAGDARWIPQHVHYEVEASGRAPRRFQLVFRDDPRMTPYWQRWAKEDGNPVIDLVRDHTGVLRGVCDVTLE
jgi:transcriptional regulator GlxA family with amidase domain